MSKVFTFILLISIIFLFLSGNVSKVTDSIMSNSTKAVENVITIMAMLCFWSGIFKVFESTSIINKISLKFSKILGYIFEKNELSEEAKKYISLNIVSNMLGIGNAATVNGIKAMKELSKYSKKEVASNNMTRFVLINTASIQLFPTTMISLRSMYESKNPTQIVIPIFIISAISLFVAMIIMRILNKIIKEE